MKSQGTIAIPKHSGKHILKVLKAVRYRKKILANLPDMEKELIELTEQLELRGSNENK
jgi:hypothetical protein